MTQQQDVGGKTVLIRERKYSKCRVHSSVLFCVLLSASVPKTTDPSPVSQISDPRMLRPANKAHTEKEQPDLRIVVFIPDHRR
jgi:hypothetical protein